MGKLNLYISYLAIILTFSFFNPQNVCWNYCYKKGDYYHKIEGTKTLYLKLDGENSAFYAE